MLVLQMKFSSCPQKVMQALSSQDAVPVADTLRDIHEVSQPEDWLGAPMVHRPIQGQQAHAVAAISSGACTSACL